MTTERAARAPLTDFLFDCDSTLSEIEGIEALADLRATPAVRAEIAALTRDAMDGRVALEEVYGRRLALVAPTREEVERIGRLYVERQVEDAAGVVAALHRLGKRVHVLSGGVRTAVLVLAAELGIPPERVHAVELCFDERGRYAGFDQHSPLARRGGKSEMVRALRAPDRRLCLIGDGATDLEAAAEVDLFVGYGGVAPRAEVRDRAPIYVRSRSLAPLLAVALEVAERTALREDPRFRALAEKAEALRAAGEVLMR